MKHASIDFLFFLDFRLFEIFHDTYELHYFLINEIRLSREDLLKVVIGSVVYLFRVLLGGLHLARIVF